MKRILLTILSIGLALTAAAQENSFVHKQADGYQWPTDPAILANLQRRLDSPAGRLHL